MRIRDPGWKKVGSGIRDKHPGSATLPDPDFFHPGSRIRQSRILIFSILDPGSDYKKGREKVALQPFLEPKFHKIKNYFILIRYRKKCVQIDKELKYF
jgi:hypothetical protein